MKHNTMVSKNFNRLAFLFMMLLPYAASKAVLSVDEIAELGCNPFSGWQTCVGKRLAERYDDREIERDIDELGTEGSEFPGQYEASSIFDIGVHNKLKNGKGAEDKSNVKQRFLNAVLKLFNKKVRNNRN